MGVKNLWDILESCKKVLPLHHLQNKRVCVDLSCWMVQLQNVNRSYCAVKDKLYLRGLFHRLRALIALNCSVVFVTDGSIPAIKLATYRKRLNSGSEATQDEVPLRDISSLKRNKGSEFSCMIKEAKILGLALGIPCLDGMEEAEAQCALLNSERLCDACFSSDSDIFLFGGRTIYRDICLGEGGYVVCYEMADIETKLGYGRNSLIALALLLGSDYSQGLYGFGPESACQIVKSVGDLGVLQKIASEGLSFAKKTKGLKKPGKIINCNGKENLVDCGINGNGSCRNNLQSEKQLLQVVDAYMKPKCHSADSDSVRRVLIQQPFQRTKLQQICAQFFDWPPEKTDEYILPKIAERDLRRFANLRSTSSKLGVTLPLHEMPVKCPVTGIIKHRRVVGEECFEVSWERIDGLPNSIVPADLIKSACPEKIVEFEESRAQGKKNKARKPRAKGPETRGLDAEVDHKLRTLVLDIESGRSAISDSSFYSKDEIWTSQPATTVTDITNHNSALTMESKSISTICNAAAPQNQIVPVEEVIDLVSPSPPKGHQNFSKFRQTEDQKADVIVLSDSENDLSPEHNRKARELRVFLASIKDDIL